MDFGDNQVKLVMVEQNGGKGSTVLSGYDASPTKIGRVSGRTRRGSSNGVDNNEGGSPTVAKSKEHDDSCAGVRSSYLAQQQRLQDPRKRQWGQEARV